MVRKLSLGNGSLLVNLDGSLRLRDLYFPYAGQENHVLGKKNKIGVHADGFSWIENWETYPAYKEDTILGDSRAFNEIEDIEIGFKDAVDCDKNVFLREVEVENKRSEERNVEIFFHQDFNMYGSDMADTCFYHPEHSGIIHYKKRRYIMAEVKREDGSCGDLAQHGIYRDDPYSDIGKKNLNGANIAQGNVNSVISIEIELAPKSSKKIYYWINTGKDLDSVLELNEKVEERIEDFFKQTEMCWRGFLGEKSDKLENIDENIVKQYKRSVLVVRGQTNDNGAITAANDSTNLEFNQDKYGYVWPRDGALVAEAMSAAGYNQLVRPFFDFAEDVIEEEGYFLHKFNPDGSLGSSWHSWVDEEGDERLPIQEDETALTVWALNEYFKNSGDEEILEEKWTSLVKPAADFMLNYFDDELHLPKPSYDLWEEKHYISTFTVASVYAGLKAASEIAEELGEGGEIYKKRAQEIKDKGIENLKSEETQRYVRGIKDGKKLDEVSAPMYFLEKFGLVDEGDSYFENTMNAIIYDLSPDTEVGGIARYSEDHYHNVTDDFDKVPGNPWIICTLWVARHLIRNAESQEDIKEARKYVNWVCKNSLETDLLPEQVNPFSGEGMSVAPLTWSHANFIRTSLMLDEKIADLKGN